MRLWGIIVVVSGLTAAGCASWKYGRNVYARMCKDADWDMLYYEAELHRGQPNNLAKQRLSVLEEACPVHNIKPDATAKAGALARVKTELCIYEKAYSWGREGNHKPLACDAEFHQEWKRGYKEYLVLQLEYLKDTGVYKSVYEGHLARMGVSKKDRLARGFAESEAKQLATRELKIKALSPKDDEEREDLIQEFTKKLGEVQ